MLMKKYHLGFTLIEVLVSLLILSLILITFDEMERIAGQKNREAYLMSVASSQLHNMSERLKALANHQDFNQQIAIWNQQNAMVLPNGIGFVLGSYPVYQVSLFWGRKTTQQICRGIQRGEINCMMEECFI